MREDVTSSPYSNEDPVLINGSIDKPASLESNSIDRAGLLRPSYRNYVLFVLMIGFALNFLDRQIISILLQPLKEELHVSDTQLGLLSGLSFALFYATLGIPLAAVADRRSRRAIIAASMAVWSAMTAVCGLTHNFLQLVIARFGVGIGEAGFSPAALSMIADYFPKEKRASAVATTSVGAMLGTMLGLLIGGWAVELVGWRGAMMIAGLPGLAFALLLFFTVREPPRGMADGVAPTPKLRYGLIRTARHLWQIKSFRYIALGAALSSFALFGFVTWMPSLLARSYHMPPKQIGFILGPILGVVGTLGALASGYATDKLIAIDARWSVWLPSVASLVAAPFAAAAFVTHSPVATVSLFACSYFLCIFFSAPTSSIIQSLMPLDMRSVGTAWKLMLVNLVGLGLGPPLIGFVSQRLQPFAGSDSLRISMLVSTIIFIVPPIFYLAAGRYLKMDSITQGGTVR